MNILARSLVLMRDLVGGPASAKRDPSLGEHRETTGRVTGIDRVCPYDPDDALVMLMVTTANRQIVRVPLTEAETKALIRQSGFDTASEQRRRHQQENSWNLPPLLTLALRALIDEARVSKPEMARALYGDDSSENRARANRVVIRLRHRNIKINWARRAGWSLAEGELERLTGGRAMTWPFGDLVPLSYDVIVCDPPWPFDLWSSKGNRKSAAHHYAVMTMQQIAALPVGRLAQRDCLLLLWVPAPRLIAAGEVMRLWGFTYRTNVVWRKVTANGKPRMGTGYWVRTTHEQVLLGTIGRPRKMAAFPSCFDGIAREHSRKPDEFYGLVLKHTTGMRRCDLFARTRRPGFDSWGDELDKFPTTGEQAA